MTPTQTGDKPMVTQADRDLVYSLMLPAAKTALERKALEYIRAGRGDDAEAVIAVARHRAQETLSPEQPIDTIQRLGQEFDGPEASPSLGMGEALDIRRLRSISERAAPAPWAVYSEPEVGLFASVFSGTVMQTGFAPVNLDDPANVEFIVEAANFLRRALAAPPDQAMERLRIMAKQRPSSKMDEDEQDGADWQGAYDWFCDESRAIYAALSSPDVGLAEENERLRPMEDAPKDGRYIIAAYRSLDGYAEHLHGRSFIIRHEGTTPSGYDLGWALFPGHGGVPDKCFSGWLPLPTTLQSISTGNP